MWGRPVFMDESPGGEMDCSPDSTGGTPYGRGMKRPCDEELDAILEAGPRTKRMEMTPCQTPTQALAISTGEGIRRQAQARSIRHARASRGGHAKATDL